MRSVGPKHCCAVTNNERRGTSAFYIYRYAIALVVVALALIVWPLVKKDHDDGLSRRKADNLAILRQQYEELEADHKRRVSDDEYEETARGNRNPCA